MRIVYMHTAVPNKNVVCSLNSTHDVSMSINTHDFFLLQYISSIYISKTLRVPLDRDESSDLQFENATHPHPQSLLSSTVLMCVNAVMSTHTMVRSEQVHDKPLHATVLNVINLGLSEW